MDSALDWLEGHKQAPFFAWVHLYDAHSPYEPPEPFLSEFRGRGMAALYDGEIAFADQQVGPARRLAAARPGWSGTRSSSSSATTARRWAATAKAPTATSSTTTPFTCRSSCPRPFDELRGVRVESQVSLVDVYPTVLALAGIDVPAPVHGRSLLPLMLQPQAEDKVYAYSESMSPNLQFGWSALHSLRSPRYKFIQAPRPELYDLAADPGEADERLRPASGRGARDGRASSIGSSRETSRDAPAPEAANLDKETVERLAALGYVGAPAAPKPPTAASQPLADPKDKLEVFTAVQRAGELMVTDEYAPAAEALESALREEPAMPQALLMLGSCYTELGRNKEAKAQFDRVLKDDPQSVQGLIGLANILLAEGQHAGRRHAVQAHALAGRPQHPGLRAARRGLRGTASSPSKALPYLEKAVEIQPKLTQNRLNLAACLIDAKQLARAQATLEEIVRDYPKFPMAQFNLGLLHEEQGRPQEARTAYAAEVANYPDAFKARFNLGKLLFAAGRPGGLDRADARGRSGSPRSGPRATSSWPAACSTSPAPLDEVQGLAEKGLALAQAPDMKAFGWFLMADVFSRRHQPDKVNEALRNARMQMLGRDRRIA